MKRWGKNSLKYLIALAMIFFLNSCFTLIKKERSLIVKNINSYVWIDLMPSFNKKQSNVLVSEEFEIVNILLDKVNIKKLELYLLDERKDKIDINLTESNPQLPITLDTNSSQIFYLKGHSNRNGIDSHETQYKVHLRIYYNYNGKELREDQLLGNVQIEKVY